MPHIDGYLNLAVSQGASDIHFASNQPVRMRIDGDLTVVDPTVLSPEQVEHILFEILNEEEREKFYKHNNLDRSYGVEGLGNFRVNVFRTRQGIAAVLRTIPSKIPTIEELGLPETLKELTEAARGLVLVTGPTGSGKSTTLAAMINHINRNCPYHILTAEDPVEFVHPCLKSLVNQREIGSNCPSFADALKYALREDPDVILVGEMRDLETISLALTAAETGHLVFGTLHTRGAAASVDRIIDSFPANQQAMIRAMLSESLVAVISQVLLKRATGRGRVAAYEIMVVNHAIANLIREGKTFQIGSAIQTGRKEGMILMDQHIRDLVAAGHVSVEEAEAYVENPAILQGVARGAVRQTAAAPAAPARPPGGAVAPPAMGGVKAPAPPPVKGNPPGMPPPMGAPRSFTPQPLKMGENTQAAIQVKAPSPPKAPQPPPPPAIGADKFSAPSAPTLKDADDGLVMGNFAEESYGGLEFSVSEDEPPAAAPPAPPIPGARPMPPPPPVPKKKVG